MSKKNALLWVFPVSLILAWLFDFLFWGRGIGFSFPFYIGLLLAAGFGMAWRAGLRPARQALWLLPFILLLALVSLWRAEPLSVLLSRLAALGLLAVLALSFLGGLWTRYGFADYAVKLLSFVPQGLGVMHSNGAAPRRTGLGRLLPVARGLLLALPLLAFLSALLASADAYFAEWLEALLANFERLPELLLRGFIVLLVAYVLAAVYAYAFQRSAKQALIGADKPWAKPFIGFPEAVTILASVNLLLGIFVFIQFRYFFGGMANIVAGPSGFTFAEYARRGFAELVVVSLTLLGFFMLLSALARREPGGQQGWFSGLGITMFALVAVVLVSAFQRLLLLEQAYGFSRLRTYPHVFMIWLGLLLLAVVLLEAMRRQRAFALAVLAASLGFVLTLPLLNVDAFIVRANIAHAQQTGRLDHAYLAQLSADAVPPLVAGYKAAAAAGEGQLADELAAGLACWAHLNPEMLEPDWRAWNLAEESAHGLWVALQAERSFPQAAFIQHDYLPAVTLDGEVWSCYAEWDSPRPER